MKVNKAYTKQASYTKVSKPCSLWLPIRAQIQYKVSTVCFNVIAGTGPQNLSELPQLYSDTPSRALRSSADTSTLGIRHSSSKALGQSKIIFICWTFCVE